MMDGQAIGWVWVWPVLVIAGLLVIAYATVRLVQSRGRYPRTLSGPGSAARRILDERYARGEIDEQEYRHRRSVLP